MITKRSLSAAPVISGRTGANVTYKGHVIVTTPNTTRSAQSREGDPRAAVREFYAGVCQPGMALVVFFCSSDYDLDALADEMMKLFQGVTVVGCTAAGEIGPVGYHDLGLTGASFPAASYTAVSGRIGDVQHFQIGEDATFQDALGAITLFGGAAGDNLKRSGSMRVSPTMRLSPSRSSVNVVRSGWRSSRLGLRSPTRQEPP